MARLAKIAKEIIQLYHNQMSLLVLSNIAGLKVADEQRSASARSCTKTGR